MWLLLTVVSVAAVLCINVICHCLQQYKVKLKCVNYDPIDIERKSNQCTESV